MVYGTALVNPPVVNVQGDPNSTRGEAVICLGEVNNIQKLVVNDEVLSPATDMDGNSGYIVPEKLMRYDVINRGGRNGRTNKDAQFDGNGDPYGSMCAVEWVVFKNVVEPSSVPNIYAVVQGPKLPVFAGIARRDHYRHDIGAEYAIR